MCGLGRSAQVLTALARHHTRTRTHAHRCADVAFVQRSCVIFPMLSQTDADKVVGILVAGVNPRHELDDNYRYILISIIFLFSIYFFKIDK